MHIAQTTAKNNDVILLLSLLRYGLKCVMIYTTKDEKKPRQKQARGCKENRQITALIARKELKAVQ